MRSSTEITMSDKQTGTVFDIQHLSVGDGPGIRTTVFLKGCPLRCAWCHNPESKLRAPQIRVDKSECVSCGKCAKVCTKGNHSVTKEHQYRSDDCDLCQNCLTLCPAGAIEIVGVERTVEDVLAEVVEDIPFYGSNGGITLSGGEPLMQFAFSTELLKGAKQNGLHTALETSGYTCEKLEEIAPFVDLWLYDIKLIHPELHKKHTGVSNEIILNNLKLLDKLGAKIILRCPMIPDINVNKGHFDGILQLYKELKNVQAIHLEPYHPLGISKAVSIGKEQAYNNPDFLNPEELNPFVEYLRKNGCTEIQIV